MGVEPKPYKKRPGEMTSEEIDEMISKTKVYAEDELYLMDNWDEYAHTLDENDMSEFARKEMMQVREERELYAITTDLLRKIKDQYRLNWHGTHGVDHWHRVYMNGIRLATQDGVNARVVQLFSVFHDACRWNEHWDPNHGKRGAELARILRKYCPLDDEEFNLLTIACELHTKAKDHDSSTVQACFDADRLDLGRVGNYPDPDLLCTSMAKEQKIIEWGYNRSLTENELPDQPFGLRDYWD